MLRPWLGPLCLAPLVACGQSLPRPPYAPQATNALTPIDLAPPPGRIERIPKQPPQANAWVDGEWILRRNRWYWLLGRWVQTPPDARYCPWVLVRAADGTPFYAPSIWIDPNGAVLPDPPAVAYATANGEAVFSPEGEAEDTGRSIKTAPPRRAANPDGPRP